MQRRFTVNDIGLVIATAVALPLVVPQIRFLVSAMQGGDLGSLALPLFIAFFLVTVGGMGLLILGMHWRSRVAYVVSALVFPIVFLTGWATLWYHGLEGGMALAEMVGTIIIALGMAYMYVWLQKRMRAEKKV